MKQALRVKTCKRFYCAAADHVRAVLKEVGGARIEAAKRLGIERTTLYRLMRKYGIADS